MTGQLPGFRSLALRNSAYELLYSAFSMKVLEQKKVREGQELQDQFENLALSGKSSDYGELLIYESQL